MDKPGGPYLIWSTLQALILTSCLGGTETDNPVVGFQSSGCKTHPAEAMQKSVGDGWVQSALMPDLSRYDGLHCYAWKLSQEGHLHIDITNMQGGCAVSWRGSAQRRDAGVDLIAENAACAVAGCGWCIYDVGFDLQDVDRSAPLPVRLLQDDCMEQELISELTLPLSTQSEGVLCRPALKYAVRPDVTDCSDKLHEPCALGATGTDAGCQDFCEDNGLVCAELVADDRRCLKPCEADSDCPLDGVLNCQAGLCKLRQAF